MKANIDDFVARCRLLRKSDVLFTGLKALNDVRKASA
jgi:hypothetical protein